MFYCRRLLFFQRKISEMHQPIGAKFCKVISTRPNFIMPVKNFSGEGLTLKKHAKFGLISKDFKLR